MSCCIWLIEPLAVLYLGCFDLLWCSCSSFFYIKIYWQQFNLLTQTVFFSFPFIKKSITLHYTIIKNRNLCNYISIKSTLLLFLEFSVLKDIFLLNIFLNMSVSEEIENFLLNNFSFLGKFSTILILKTDKHECKYASQFLFSIWGTKQLWSRGTKRGICWAGMLLILIAFLTYSFSYFLNYWQKKLISSFHLFTNKANM